MSITMNRAMYILGHAYGPNGARGISAYFEGRPGGGKTTKVRSFARKYLDSNCLSFELSRSQGTDLNIPIPDHNRKRVDFYTAGPIQDLAEKEQGILFFDEITRANDQGTLAASLNIFLDRALGDVKFKHIITWACANPAGMVGGIELDVAFANRIVIVKWPDSMDVEDFAEHMNAVDPVTGVRDSDTEWPPAPTGWEIKWPEAFEQAVREVASFHRVRSGDLLEEEPPASFRPWRSARSWHTATCVLAACRLHNATTSETETLLGGTIGPEAAHAFVAWLDNNNLPNPVDVCNGKVDLSAIPAEDVFVALSAAADYFLNLRRKDMTEANKLNKSFAEALVKQLKNNMETVAPIAGRLGRASVTSPEFLQLYTPCLAIK